MSLDHDRELYSYSTVCPCNVIDETLNANYYQVLSFIGNDYFCESGNPGPGRIDGRLFNDAVRPHPLKGIVTKLNCLDIVAWGSTYQAGLH